MFFTGIAPSNATWSLITLKDGSDKAASSEAVFPGFDELTENDKALKKAYKNFLAKLPSTAQVKTALE